MLRRTALKTAALLPAAVAPSSPVWSLERGDVDVLERLWRAATSARLSSLKLGVDALVDPRADVSDAERRIDALAAAAVRQFPGLRSTVEQRVQAVGRVVYEPGAWNQQSPFRYDLERDPSGTEILENALLTTYLVTRRGNCVSMPALVIAVLERIGVEVFLARAPEHFFVKFRTSVGGLQGLECTSTLGPKADASYVREMEISRRAQERQLYLTPLSAGEALLAWTGTLATHYYRTRALRQLERLADFVQQAQPRSLESIQTRTAAVGLELNVRYRDRFKRFEDLPASDKRAAQRLLAKIAELDRQAEELGWRPLSPAFQKNYRQLVTGKGA